MNAILPWTIHFALACFALAMICALIRLLRGPAAQDRILALDTLYINGMLSILTLGIGFGSTDLAGALAAGRLWMRIPASIRVELRGAHQRASRPAARRSRRAASTSRRCSARASTARAAGTASGSTETDVMPKRTRCSANSGRLLGA